MPKLSLAAKAAATPASTKPITCGFCSTGNHENCPRAVANGERPRRVWPCACAEPGCGGGAILRCLTCKTETPGEVSPATWECLDPEACSVRVTKRLAANPAFQQIKEIAMPNAAKKVTAVAKVRSKPVKEPRDCGCGCDGQTGGGTFLPGHDARFVKNLVAEVASKRYTATAKKAAVRTMREAGASDTLIAKFEKNVATAEARGDTGAAKAASPKPAAKKTAAKKATSGKAPAVEPVTVPDDAGDDEDF